MAIKAIRSNQIEQQAIENLFLKRQNGIAIAVSDETRKRILSGKMSAQGPFRIEDMDPQLLPFVQNVIDATNEQIVIVRSNLHYKQNLKMPVMTDQGNRAIKGHVDACVRRSKQKAAEFFKRFVKGEIDTSALPEPEQPCFKPKRGDIRYDLSDEQLAFVTRQYTAKEAHNNQMQKEVTHVNQQAQLHIEACNVRLSVIHGLGDLEMQMQFLHFIQEKLQEKGTLDDLSLEKLLDLKAEFLALDEDFAIPIPSHAVDAPKSRKKKNKRNKQKKQPAQPVPSPQNREATPKARAVAPTAVLNPSAQEAADLLVRLNSFNSPKGCVPEDRLVRWSKISLANPESILSIRAFVDFDINNKPIKPYEHCEPVELRMHKENHDIPMHTIHREEALLRDYSNLKPHYSPKNGWQYGRLFHAEKITKDAAGELQVEKGIIKTAVGEDNVLFHSQFVRTSRLEPAHFDPQGRGLSGVEEKDDGGGDGGPAQFQFRGKRQKGKHRIEIDPETKAIIIKIGQDNDPNQVIYRIKRLRRQAA